MKKSFSIMLILVLLGFITNAQPEKIPVTSTSKRAVVLFHEALKASENAEMANAREKMNEAIKEDPKFFRGHVFFALINLYSGNQEAFKKHSEKALIKNSSLSNGEILIQTALRRLHENPKADVTDVGNKLIELFPRDDQAYYILTSFQRFINDPKGIIKTYNTLLEKTDNPAPVYNQLGYIYLQLNDFLAAEKAFNKYIELFPNHPNPYDSKGDFFMQVKDYPNAWSNYMTANRINESWSYEKAMKAKDLMEKTSFTSKSEDVEKKFKEGLELHRQVVGNINRRLDDEAKVLFVKTLELDPSYVPALVQLGWIYSSRETKKFWEPGYLDSAFYFAQRALYFDKEASPVYGLLATIYLSKGRYEDALTANKKALEFDSGTAAIYRSIGELHFNSGDYFNAIDYTLKQLEKEKNTGTGYWTLNNLFYQLCRTGFFNESNEFNEQILLLRHDSTIYCNNKMFSYFLESDFDAGVQLAKQSLRNNPANNNCLFFLGWATLFQRNYDEAYKWFSQLAELAKASGQQVNPDPGYGFVCLQKGMNEEANYHFNGAVLNSNRIIKANYYPEVNLPHIMLASVCSAKGEKQKAIDHLRNNKSYHMQALVFLKSSPMFDNIRNEPEFQNILKETEIKYNDVHQRVGKILAEK
jgi:tetratricopeptide (TPR) repeat protein